jgi:hypothetical protein
VTFAEEFEKLRLEFVVHSIQRLAEMQALVDLLGREPADHDLAGRLRTHFHAFAGLGTTYGRPEATRIGERGELLMSALVASGSAVRPDDVTAIRELLDELRAQFV